MIDDELEARGLYPLSLLDPPFAVPGFAISMFWHARRSGDRAHGFLRTQFEQAARALPSKKRARMR